MRSLDVEAAERSTGEFAIAEVTRRLMARSRR
jgi:hypothetical protein